MNEFMYTSANEVDKLGDIERLLGISNDDSCECQDNLIAYDDYIREHSQELAYSKNGLQLTFEKFDVACNKLKDYIPMCESIAYSKNIAVLVDEEAISRLIYIIALLKSGLKGKLIDSKLSYDYIREIIDYLNINVVISVEKHLKVLNKILWECQSLKSYICIDSSDIYKEETEKSKLMSRKLWEIVGINAKDEIAGGGWINSYTREHFSTQEMDEFANNIFLKLKNFIDKDKKVLEIGCASGISMFKIAPYVGEYFGTDLSGVIIEKNREEVEKLGFKNIRLQNVAANEIGGIDGRNFDIVVMNSVTHCFSGVNYLRKVILSVIELMNEQGVIFIGDIMDLNKKSELINSLFDFKMRNPHYKTKTDLSEELFISKEYFEDLIMDLLCIKKLNFFNKIYTLENELTKFRYDVIIEIDKTQRENVTRLDKHKYQFGINVYQ